MSTLRDAFWTFALGIIAAFLFFLALGAITPAGATVATVVVAVLAIAWVLHAFLPHGVVAERDARLVSARERRGF